VKFATDHRGQVAELKVSVPVEDIRKIERMIMDDTRRYGDDYGKLNERDFATLSSVRFYMEEAIREYAKECVQRVQKMEREDKIKEVRNLMDQIGKQGNFDGIEAADMLLNRVKEDAPISQIDDLLGQLHQLADRKAIEKSEPNQGVEQPKPRYYEPQPKQDYDRGDDR
jgi:hypothetical protein